MFLVGRPALPHRQGTASPAGPRRGRADAPCAGPAAAFPTTANRFHRRVPYASARPASNVPAVAVFGPGRRAHRRTSRVREPASLLDVDGRLAGLVSVAALEGRLSSVRHRLGSPGNHRLVRASRPVCKWPADAAYLGVGRAARAGGAAGAPHPPRSRVTGFLFLIRSCSVALATGRAPR